MPMPPWRSCRCLAKTRPPDIALEHGGAEIGIFARIERRARVMRRDPPVLRREAEGDGDVERRQRLHLPVEPVERIGPEAVGPGEAGPEMLDAEPLEPAHRIGEAMILVMEPLADAECRRPPGEPFERRLGRAVLAQETHVEMPVVGRALRLLVARRGTPGLRQIIEAVPVNAGAMRSEQVGRAVDSPGLPLLGAE